MKALVRGELYCLVRIESAEDRARFKGRAGFGWGVAQVNKATEVVARMNMGESVALISHDISTAPCTYFIISRPLFDVLDLVAAESNEFGPVCP